MAEENGSGVVKTIVAILSTAGLVGSMLFFNNSDHKKDIDVLRGDLNKTISRLEYREKQITELLEETGRQDERIKFLEKKEEVE